MMNLKKLTIGAMITFAVAVAAVGMGTVGNGSSYSYAAETEQAELAVATPTAYNGWITKNGKRYYYENGKKLTNKLFEQKEKKNGKTVTYRYYLNKDGSLYGGLKRVNGKLYYFNIDDKSHPGAAITGWKTVNGRKYYFLSKDNSAVSGMKSISGKTYYFGSNGYAVKGLNKVGKYYYFFGSGCVMQKSKWVNTKSGKYYFGKDGRAYTGLHKISGYRFYFNANGRMIKGSWKTVRKKTYYFGSKGKALTGLRKIGKYRYYFDKKGVKVKNKFVTVKGKKYYFGADGRAYTGVRKVKGYKYYFNFSSKGYLTGGVKYKNGKKYRFRNTGRPYIGWYTDAAGNVYYYKKDGTAAVGSAKVGKAVYVFNKKGVQIRTAGWHKVKGKTYYIDSSDMAVTGYRAIDGSYYYFGKNGVMYRNKWAYADGYKFYFGADGKRLNDTSSVLGTGASYQIKVNKTTNVVTVYAKDGNKGYIIPVKAFICSTGNATPVGTFYTPAKWRWLTLMGPCYGQWCTQITGDILFHSVYYSAVNANTLAVSAYNQLGTTCSHGCVRLTAADAKWIYDNCGLGMAVTIYTGSDSGPFPKPSAYKLGGSHTWDPTDPNMYYKCRQYGCH